MRRKAIRFLQNPVTAGVLLVSAIGLTVFGWYFSNKLMLERAEDRFSYRIRDVQSAIEKRMLDYEQVLRGAVALMNVNNKITRSQWKNYVSTLRLNKYYPGIQGLGLSVKIDSSDLDEHIKSVRAEGFTNYKIIPEGPRKEYHSIIFLEPFEGRNLRAFGFDMYSQPVRRAAMELARDSAFPAMSGVVILVQETGKDVQKGFLLYLPVYKNGFIITSVEQRRAALLGFVYSPFRVKDLMHGILGRGMPDIQFQIYDGANLNPQNLLYQSEGEMGSPPGNSFADTLKLNFAGRSWTLSFKSRENFISRFESSQPVLIAVGGIVVDVLLFYMLWSVSVLNKQNNLLAEKFKREKERYELVAQSTNDVIWDWDIGTGKVRWNENYHYAFGFPKEELILDLNSWYDNIPEPERQRVTDGVYHAINSGKKYWHDEYDFVLANGSVVHILDRGYVIHDDDGLPVRMVGSMIDITSRKKEEEANRRFAEQLEDTVRQRTMELQRSNEDLQQFAHIISHDLKEPVRKIKTFLNLVHLEHWNELSDTVRFYLGKVNKSADRIKKMIDGVLSYSLVSSGGQLTEKVDLNEIVNQVTNELELMIRDKQAEVHSDKLPVIEGASVLIYQLFYNIINNSLKFSHGDRSPVIRISSRTEKEDGKDFAVIDITDNGIGFDAAYSKKIFEAFTRLHSKDDYEGTGLGLALCKKIVERHKGTIFAVGEANVGATFTMRIPLTQQ